jgi:predicted phage terminase large subunit-like protein
MPPKTGDPFLDRQMQYLARTASTNKPKVKMPFSPPESLFEFMRMFWFILEPERPFLPARHLEVVCEHLEACSRGELRKLIINIPPGFAKSLTCNVFWVARDWTLNPSLRWLMVSYAQNLTIRDSLKTRWLIESEEYQAMYGHGYQLMIDQNAKGYYETNKRGFRVAMPIDSATGQRVDRLVIDDPHNTKKAAKEGIENTELERAETSYRTSLATRATDVKTWVQLLIMQRVAERDLTGVFEDIGGWEILRLPLRYEPERHSSTNVGGDWRTTPGELLWIEGKDETDSLEVERDLGARVAAAQLQQNPAPSTGGVFEKSWIRYWLPLELANWKEPRTKEDPDPSLVEVLELTMRDLANGIGTDSQIQSWDFALTDTGSSAYGVGQLWASMAARRLMLDQTRGRWNMPQAIQEVRNFSNTWQHATAKYMENKANGPAIMQTLRTEISGLIPVDPVGGKEARAVAVQPFWEAHNVLLPHPRMYPWVAGFVLEMLGFPRSAFKDQVDTMTQGLDRLRFAGGDNNRLARGGRSERR